jgi:transcriptional regulator with XRE-family HTH domain
MMTDLSFNEQLADFLKTRRARLKPEQVGLKAGTRRRTPGLRREEVAELANLSVAWYTWLEQGRDIRLSRNAARRLARALRLDELETNHLLALSDIGQPDGIELPATVSATLQKIIEAQGDNPAYVMNERWDVLVWNSASELLFGCFSREMFGEANALRHMFLDRVSRTCIVNWEKHAHRMAAQFRLTSDRIGKKPPEFEELIAELRAGSLEFERFWTSHDILPRTVGQKEFDHPTMGKLAFNHAAFQVNEDRTLKMVIYVASDSVSKAKINQALRTRRDR